MKELLSLPALLAIALIALSVGHAGYALNTETAFFWPDSAFKIEAVAAVWLSVIVVASALTISGGHGKRLVLFFVERPRHTSSIDKTNHNLSRDTGGHRNHQTFGAASGGHLARLAGRFQQLVGHGAGGQMRLQLARNSAHA